MRFLPEGPDIPDDLITAQERGQVIFICGAGVSMSLGLPNFRDLVLKIYEVLGEDPTLHLAENEAIRENGLLAGQYDRVLRLLEKRLAASNVGRANGMAASSEVQANLGTRFSATQTGSTCSK